jgi:hypothetical protein
MRVTESCRAFGQQQGKMQEKNCVNDWAIMISRLCCRSLRFSLCCPRAPAVHLPDGLLRTFTAATTPTPTGDMRLAVSCAPSRRGRSASTIVNGGDGVEQQPLHFRTRVGLVLLSAAGCCWFFVLAKRQDDDSSDEEEGRGGGCRGGSSG